MKKVYNPTARHFKSIDNNKHSKLDSKLTSNSKNILSINIIYSIKDFQIQIYLFIVNNRKNDAGIAPFMPLLGLNTKGSVTISLYPLKCLKIMAI